MTITFEFMDMPNLAAAADNAGVIEKIALEIVRVSGTQITFNYTTMEHNNPNQYANTVYLWQSASSAIPWNQKPIASALIPTDKQAGSATISGLKISNLSYILGYAVGPDIKNIAATAFIPASGTKYEYFSTTLSSFDPVVNTVPFEYKTPANYTPKTNKAWVGIWTSDVPLPAKGEIQRISLDSDTSDGESTFNNLDLIRGTKYSLGLFLGEKDTPLAATCSFIV